MYTLILDIAYFMNQPNIIIKTILIGDAGVGKTSFAKKLTNVGIRNNEISTIGVDFFNLDAIVDNQKIRLCIWDAAGNEKFIHLVKNYFRDNAFCYVVYDVCNYKSFSSVQKWIDVYKSNNYNINTSIVILANKIDLHQKRTVSKEDGLLLAKKNNALFFEISLKNSIGLDNLIKEPVQKLLEIYKNNPETLENNGFKYIKIEKKKKKKCCSIK